MNTVDCKGVNTLESKRALFIESKSKSETGETEVHSKATTAVAAAKKTMFLLKCIL